MVLAAVALVCTVLLCAHFAILMYGRRARKLLAPLPTLPTLPFLGNAHQLLGDGPFMFKTLELLSKFNEDTGKPFACWIGPRAAIKKTAINDLINHTFTVLADPDDVKTVTNAYVEKPYYYGFARLWVGNGLVTAPGHIWKHNIKSLCGTFSANIVEGYQEVFNTNAAILVESLQQEIGKEPFDVYEHLSYATLETICQTALGVPKISQSIITKEYYHSFNKVLELLISRAKNIVYHLDWVYRLSPHYRELMRHVGVLHHVSETIMSKRMDERKLMKENGRGKEISDPEDDKHRFKAFLDILLELGDVDPTMTQQQIKSEIDTIIVGGQETVSTTMFMTLLVVGSKPAVQENMVNELREIFGDSKRSIEKEDLARMRYCEAVINETLRIFPPIPCMLRDADKDLQIKSCTIPAGVTCAINAWGAGRSKRVWGEDALEFKPERWLNTADNPINPATFLPFSYGRRSCIGKRYAYAIMKTIVGNILRQLEVSSNIDDIKFKVDVSLKAISGHLITVKRRE